MSSIISKTISVGYSFWRPGGKQHLTGSLKNVSKHLHGLLIVTLQKPCLEFRTFSKYLWEKTHLKTVAGVEICLLPGNYWCAKLQLFYLTLILVDEMFENQFWLTNTTWFWYNTKSKLDQYHRYRSNTSNLWCRRIQFTTGEQCHFLSVWHIWTYYKLFYNWL